MQGKQFYSILFGFLLPAILVAGFLFYFLYDLYYYRINFDDTLADKISNEYGIMPCIRFYFKLANGRWFSHLVTALTFTFLTDNYSIYAAYLISLMLLFVVSVTILLYNYSLTFLKNKLSRSVCFLYGSGFTACLYFMLFEGRLETWAWISSAHAHLLSVLLSFILFSLLFKTNTRATISISVFIISACLGGLNEVNALGATLCIVGLYLVNRLSLSPVKLSFLNSILAILGISVSLLINLFSGGFSMRMYGLPNFTLWQSIKNTVHTLVLPFMHFNYLPIALGAFFIYVLSIRTKAPFKPGKNELFIFLSVLILCTIVVFLHCLILSDIVPARAQLWACALFLFMVTVYLLKQNEKEYPEGKLFAAPGF